MTSISCIMRAANVAAVDYPLAEAVESALHFADEVCLAVAVQNTDNTLEIVLDLQRRFGISRFKFSRMPFVWNQDWQVAAWHTARDLATGSWLYLLDADEAIHEAECRAIIQAAHRVQAPMYRQPVYHFYGTPDFVAVGPQWYKAHTRLAHKSVNYRMVNRRRENGNAPVCDLVATVGGKDVLAHVHMGDGIAELNVPIYHYGWVRDARAMTAHNVRFEAYYQDTGDDSLPPAPPPFDFNLPALVARGEVQQTKVHHPAVMQNWFTKHREQWRHRVGELEGVNG